MAKSKSKKGCSKFTKRVKPILKKARKNGCVFSNSKLCERLDRRFKKVIKQARKSGCGTFIHQKFIKG